MSGPEIGRLLAQVHGLLALLTVILTNNFELALIIVLAGVIAAINNVRWR